MKITVFEIEDSPRPSAQLQQVLEQLFPEEDEFECPIKSMERKHDGKEGIQIHAVPVSKEDLNEFLSELGQAVKSAAKAMEKADPPAPAGDPDPAVMDPAPDSE